MVERDLYDSIEHAMISVFIAVTGEQWNEQWMETYRVLGLWTGVYYVVLVMVGDYIILNLVVAIVIREVGKADAYIRELNQQDQSIAFDGNAIVRNRVMRIPGTIVAPPDAFEESSEDHDDPHDDERAVRCCEAGLRGLHRFLEERREHSLLLFPPNSCIRRMASKLLLARVPGTPVGLESLVIVTIVISSCAVAFDAGCSGFVGGAHSDAKLLLWQHDGQASVSLDLPHLLNSYLLLATTVSLTEIGLKILAHGLLFTEHAYLKSGWNQLDAAIAIVCIAELVETGLPAGLVLRSIHVLRPIRLIARLSGMQRVVRVLYEVLPRVGNILLVYCLFLAVFAVLGVQLFAGKFGACATDDALRNKAACEGAGEVWLAHPDTGSFDNFLSASLMLFEVSSLEGWPNAMYLGVDAVGVDEAQELDHNPAMSLYFIAWVFLGGACPTAAAPSPLPPHPRPCRASGLSLSMPSSPVALPYASRSVRYLTICSPLLFSPPTIHRTRSRSHSVNAGFVVLNVFVGVLIDTFAQMESTDRFGGIFTSHQQQHWVETLEASTSVKPYRRHQSPRDGGCRTWLYRRITDQRFESLIMMVILFNSCLMAADSADTPPQQHALLDHMNDACTAVFLVEVRSTPTAPFRSAIPPCFTFPLSAHHTSADLCVPGRTRVR